MGGVLHTHTWWWGEYLGAPGESVCYTLYHPRGKQDTEGSICPHPGKKHPEERDEVSCLVSGLTRTSIAHQDAKPEVRCSHGQGFPDSPHPSSCGKLGIKEAGEASSLVVA